MTTKMLMAYVIGIGLGMVAGLIISMLIGLSTNCKCMCSKDDTNSCCN